MISFMKALLEAKGVAAPKLEASDFWDLEEPPSDEVELAGPDWVKTSPQLESQTRSSSSVRAEKSTTLLFLSFDSTIRTGLGGAIEYKE